MSYPGPSEQRNPQPQHYWNTVGAPPPPVKGRTGLAIGILIGVLTLVAFCITGFAAPGFLLAEGGGTLPPVTSSSPAPTSAPTSSETSSETSTRVSRPSRPRVTVTRRPAPGAPEKGVQVIRDFLAKIGGSDKAGAIALACEHQRRFMDDKIDSLLPLGSRVEITKPAERPGSPSPMSPEPSKTGPPKAR
ncbi:hypothetical protein [Amycolatopsis sp. cmx-11-32]|uniref:hypothetical protein n=1 Tax=Amycolatopsis sp. cmx-11-32 TaxID=2785796 RepID=UPI0039E67936